MSEVSLETVASANAESPEIPPRAVVGGHSKSFHAHHSPMGAFSSLTLGHFNREGGMASEIGHPVNSAVFVGCRRGDGRITCLPFMEGVENEAERYSQSNTEGASASEVFSRDEIERCYRWGTDRFCAPGIDFRISTPFFSIPDPATGSDEALKFACCPASFLTLEINNDSDEAWDGFFALQSDRNWAPLSDRVAGLAGATSRDSLGFATNDEVDEFCDFSVDRSFEGLHATPRFLLGPVAGVRFRVAPGESRRIRLVVGYYLAGNVTFNRTASYYYTRHFADLTEVFRYALERFERYEHEAIKRDRELLASGLSDDQQFLVAHSTRSYFGSTQWLEADGRPIWIVNEGEYLMMNTLDLTVDMIFFELRYNPWTVRNVLEHFVEAYSYHDRLISPGSPGVAVRGGRSFCHDMGVGNHFSPRGHSSYECAGLDRECFSYMTCEQLTNWILCAGVYWSRTGDDDFLLKHGEVLKECLDSLLRRDHPKPDQRNGLMGFESSRCEGGGEITTYDSLDHSLGQARANIYLGGKCWASFLALEQMFDALGESLLAAECASAAIRTSRTIADGYDPGLGFIPAVLEGGNRSAIISAGEALVYPWVMGLRDAVRSDGPHGHYIEALKRHLRHILKPGICLYDDGAWKLSSSADNSWMSKICLNQFVVREILGIDDPDQHRADAAHVRWQVEGAKFHACSDQFSNGQPIGSLYYPRIVTSILWLSENQADST